MSICQLLLLALTTGQGGDAVTLRHAFAANDVQKFVMVNTLNGEEQGGALLTWQPFKLVVTDHYSFKVVDLAPAGTADLRYESEGAIYHRGQESGSDPSDDKQDPEWMIVTMSPINEFLAILDQSKPKSKKKKPNQPDDEGDGRITVVAPREPNLQITANVIQTVVSTFLSLRLLEFGPTLPWHPVKLGDTWDDTLSSLPGQTPNRDPSKRAPHNQRLDIVYRYDGVKQHDGKPVWVIHGKYSANLDLKHNLLEGAPKQILDMKPITSADVKVNGELDFYLDQKTGNTMWVQSSASGEVNVETPETFQMLRHQIRLKAEATVKPVK